MTKINVALLFGGRSTEHEVSIITALQILHNLNIEKYTVFPIYLTKKGTWLLGGSAFYLPETFKDLDKASSKGTRTQLSLERILESQIVSTKGLKLFLKKTTIDVAFPAFHGTFGEDGTIQGLFDLLDIPYVGSGLLGSALGMDKVAQKQIYQSAKLPVLKYTWFYKTEWQKDPKKILKNIKLKLPLFVKPANCGSSIGITMVTSKKDLPDAIDVAGCYDRKILIEEGLKNPRDINISVLGNSGHGLKVSVCEEPIKSNPLLSYKDKYESGQKSKGMASAKRIIPAHIKPQTKNKIAEIARQAFRSLDCSGLARLDFLVDKNEKSVFINEINTLPGSLAYYLWQKTGISYPKLLDRLISLALERHSERKSLTYTFSSNILSHLGESPKGGKLKGKF